MKAQMYALVFLILMLAQASLLRADDIPEFKTIGYTLISLTNQEDGRSTATLRDAAGRESTVTWDLTPDPGSLRKIAELRDIAYSWTDMDVRSLSIILSGLTVEAVIIPERLTIEGNDIARFLPAGLGFYYRDYIQFDFRMVKDSISMRLAGRFIDRAGLSTLMQRAIDNPLTFADKTNYMARLDRLDRILEELTARNARLEREHQLLRHATLRLFNTGFLCGPDEIPEKSVKRAVAIKTAHPKYDVDALRAALRKEGIKLSGGEVELILAIYFNEWDD